jgi:hypothetical protein
MWGNLDGNFLFFFPSETRFIFYRNPDPDPDLRWFAMLDPDPQSDPRRTMRVRNIGRDMCNFIPIRTENLCPSVTRVVIYPDPNFSTRIRIRIRILLSSLKWSLCSSTTTEWWGKLVSRIQMFVLDPEALDPGSLPQRNQNRFIICAVVENRKFKFATSGTIHPTYLCIPLDCLNHWYTWCASLKSKRARYISI